MDELYFLGSCHTRKVLSEEGESVFKVTKTDKKIKLQVSDLILKFNYLDFLWEKLEIAL